MLKIALCDFNHTTIGIHTETMPLAIGLLGSYVRHLYPGAVDVRLFKFTDDFLTELESWRPDVMGLSLYSWNTKLNLYMAEYARRLLPRLVVVAGGPNIPIEISDAWAFFEKYPFVALLVNKDGEIPFAKIVGMLLGGHSQEELIEACVPGTIALEPGSRQVVQVPLGEKLHSLDGVPSPYLNGLMNKFFAYKHYSLAPFIETNRGCPFACTFCHSASKYYNKLQWGSLDRLEAEIELFGSHFRDRHDVRLFLADNNFGSFTQDYEFARIVRRAQEKYNWPRYIDVTTGKTKPDHIIKVVSVLKWGLTTTASLQTLTAPVLRNISRKNLPFADFVRLQEKTKQYGSFSSTELIMSLPGETRTSFLQSIREVIEADVEQIIIYTLMNLRGTPLHEQHKSNAAGYIFRYRVVPRQFGYYMGQHVFDTEEVIVQTPTISYEDYLYLRGFALVVQAVYNDSNYLELIRFLKENGVSVYHWLLDIYERLRTGSTLASQQLAAFLDETQQELWSSEEALYDFYRQEENYRRLVTGEIGGNLLAKYTSLARFHGFQSWLDVTLTSAAQQMRHDHQGVSADEIATILRDFETYFLFTRKLSHLFESDQVDQLRKGAVIQLTYDIPAWAENRNRDNLIQHGKNHGYYDVRYSEEQLHTIRTIATHEPHEKSVKLQYLLKGHSRDFWATASRRQGP
jgi:radical SAM superfamily enzyme YgiQ (UPF0313 family)